MERVSYDVLTPSAARGILEAIHWKPAIRWNIDRIHVLRPIRFQSLRRNEIGVKISSAKAATAMRRATTVGLEAAADEHRQQRSALVLVDVAYVIEAPFTMTSRAGPTDTPGKHYAMFNRRAAQGQCFHRPCLGTREFPAEFGLLEDGAPLPSYDPPLVNRNRDFGWMLRDIDFASSQPEARFFRATMHDGVIDVPPFFAASAAASAGQ